MTKKQENYLLSIAGALKGTDIERIEFRQRNDYISERDISNYISIEYPSLEELKELRGKPAVVTTWQYGNEKISRLTKYGWEMANKIAIDRLICESEYFEGEQEMWDKIFWSLN